MAVNDKDIKNAFETFDQDNDGKIGANDWKKVLTVLKQHCNSELDEMTFDEFEKIAQEIVNDENETDDAMNHTFKLLDQSNKGYISADDIKKIMVKLGDPLSDEEVQAVVQQITKGTDKITLDQFKKTLCK
mmetsp:Transcript_68448/g.108697  ORF Transcript_68448/g.108697 Transcript_68448/m.108697 type:complete len:131 (+) Transcript_68448:55-447(+)|eukprot:CAMPEP_0197022264 /NCGR_PEP_ID=MMETSP1384-20130603/3179_1 /TAXON_ID=29189 /ORGANISM="Ammonia sp." /LENGTH=130 /DNA_ID=CAMNT_0042450275 /DNA_START=45 /DNA_END=437 /DNA_ORIENTATION=+